MADLTPEQRAELIAHGWRAPGPPTEEEVERAVGPTAAALAAVYGSPLGHLSPTHVELYERDARVAARAALTAALGRPE